VARARARGALTGGDVPVTPESAPEEPPRKVRAVKQFTTKVPIPIAGSTTLTTGEAALLVVNPGDEFDADDPFVQAHADAFEAA
jgi:hypothetical protein